MRSRLCCREVRLLPHESRFGLTIQISNIPLWIGVHTSGWLRPLFPKEALVMHWASALQLYQILVNHVGAIMYSQRMLRRMLSKCCAHAGQFTEAQAERWWEHYIAVKLDLVQSVLQDDVGSEGDLGTAGPSPWTRTGSSPAR